MHRLCTLLAAIFVAAIAATSAFAGSSVSYGIQDDAWLRYGPGTVEERVATLQGLGLDVVRVTVRWDAIEDGAGHVRLGRARTPSSSSSTPLGSTPSSRSTERPNGPTAARGRTSRRSAGPTSPRSPALRPSRYPFVHRWTIWNEPNQRRWLSTASPAQYVTRLLNPAYTAIHAASPSSRVAGGVTAPRGGAGGLSPVAFIRGMGSQRRPPRRVRASSVRARRRRRRRGAAAATTARRSRWRRSTAS